MKSRSFAVSLVCLAAMALPPRAKAPPVMPRPPEPGTPLGSAKSYWLAPYVKASQETIGKHGSQTLTWYSEDGSAKTLAINGTQQGFAWTTPENGLGVAVGINEPWKIVFPKKPDDFKIGPFAGSIHCTADSRTFVKPFTPEPGQIAADVYVHGVLKTTLGPFVRNSANDFEMNEDGSMAILIYKDETKTTPQIVCADHNGEVRFRVDCANGDRSPIPAPDGMAVLLQGTSERRQNLTCYTREGKGRTVAQVDNSRCIGWVPGTLRSLFAKSLGFDGHYQMIDWDSGKEIWDIPCPGNLHAQSIVITSQLVIFVVAEYYKGYHTGGWWGDSQWMLRKEEAPLIRAFYAARVEDGRLVSRWQAAYPRLFTERDRARLMQVGKKLYFVTAEEFTEINEDDILSGKNEWEMITGDR